MSCHHSQLKCDRCNVDYKIGFAIFVEPDKGRVCCAYRYYDKLALVKCLKCPKCGQSEFL